jgi:hypothetical protein
VVGPGTGCPGLATVSISITALGSIAGAWALGCAYVLRSMARMDRKVIERDQRMQRSHRVIAEEIQPLGEGRRFAIRIVTE